MVLKFILAAAPSFYANQSGILPFILNGTYEYGTYYSHSNSIAHYYI